MLAVHGVTKSRTQVRDWTELKTAIYLLSFLKKIVMTKKWEKNACVTLTNCIQILILLLTINFTIFSRGKILNGSFKILPQIIWKSSHQEEHTLSLTLEVRQACDCFTQQNMVKVILREFWGWVIKGHIPPSWNSGSWSLQLPCRKPNYLYASMFWGSPCYKERPYSDTLRQQFWAYLLSHLSPDAKYGSEEASVCVCFPTFNPSLAMQNFAEAPYISDHRKVIAMFK